MQEAGCLPDFSAEKIFLFPEFAMMPYFRFYMQSQKAPSLVGWLLGALILLEWVLPIETPDPPYVMEPPRHSCES